MLDGDGEMEQEQAGAWLPVMEAARRLGVSERTLRRHIRQSRYQIQREGRRVRVFLPGMAAHGSASPAQDAPGLASVLQTALETLASALEAERARTNRLEARLRALEDERWALEVPPIHAVPKRERRRRGA